MKKLKRPKLTRTQLALLEHLAAVAIQQKAEARRTKKRFKQGWTAVEFNKRVKVSDMERLFAFDLANGTCYPRAYPDDQFRITRNGVEYLELILGEVIYA